MDSPSAAFLLVVMTWIAWGLVGWVTLGMVVLRLVIARDPSTPVSTWRNLARGCPRIGAGVLGFFALLGVIVVLLGEGWPFVLAYLWRVVLPVALTFAALWAGFSVLARVRAG
jgi:hypothetical protein